MDAKSLTNTGYEHMKRKSRQDLCKLLGAYNEWILAQSKSEEVTRPLIESEIRLFNRWSSITLHGKKDPLYEVYQQIEAKVTIKWD